MGPPPARGWTTRSTASEAIIVDSTSAIYDFARNAHPILTLYDSGGLDTLNLSGWSTPSRIDLHAGAFSSGNDMSNNIAIAYNTTIENAEGGGGNDVITGNDTANLLRGAAGNDELYGSAGDDTLVGGTGNDDLRGGAGTDTAVFEGNFASYTISSSGGVLTISGAASGSDRISEVERFQFADSTRTLDQLSPDSDTTAPQLVGLNPSDNGKQRRRRCESGAQLQRGHQGRQRYDQHLQQRRQPGAQHQRR
jgi:Ca2+-binding RTX toxin-like protein